MSGIGFFWHEQCALSCTTYESRGGQQDALIHVRGHDTHHHLWVANPGVLEISGQRLKSEAITPSMGRFWEESGGNKREGTRIDTNLG
jgi:hypothetical protein